jgi:transcriptional regulator with XRE-family HTH domain
MVRYTHEEIVEKLLSDPENKKEYEALEEEFYLFGEMLKARLNAGKTQDDVAEALHTTKSAVSRLENSGGKKRHSPTIETLRKYAKALNCQLRVQFVPLKKQKKS